MLPPGRREEDDEIQHAHEPVEIEGDDEVDRPHRIQERQDDRADQRDPDERRRDELEAAMQSLLRGGVVGPGQRAVHVFFFLLMVMLGSPA